MKQKTGKQQINEETKCRLVEKTIKPLAILINKNKEETHVTKYNVRIERGDITTDCTEIKNIQKEYYKHLLYISLTTLMKWIHSLEGTNYVMKLTSEEG